MKKLVVHLILCGACVLNLKAQSPSAPVFTVLHSFAGTDGKSPESPVTEITPGVFLGITSDSNVTTTSILYKITSAGQFTVIHVFDYQTEGWISYQRMCLATDGYLYGDLVAYGPYPLYNGSVFKTDAEGNVTVIGDDPNNAMGLISAPIEVNGIMYGTTALNDSPFQGVYSFPVGGTTLAYAEPLGNQLDNLSAGGFPIVVGSDASFYGIGGIDFGYLEGNLFKITSKGVYTTWSPFNGTNGSAVNGVVFPATNGLLYAVTGEGGANGLGTIDSITTAGVVTVLHSFSAADGGSPHAGLWQASDGMLYGTNNGIYRMSLDGSVFQVLFTFPGGNQPDGSEAPGLIQGSDGKLYGTTLKGGKNNDGQIFSFDIGLPAPKRVAGCLP